MKTLCSIFVLLSVVVAPASAGITLAFSTSSTALVSPPLNAGTPEFLVASNGTVDVHVFATESTPNTELSVTGLFSGGVRLDFDATVGNATAGPALPTEGQFSNAVGAANGAGFSQVFGYETSALGSTVVKGSSIHVATFTFSGGAVNNTTTVTAVKPIDAALTTVFILDDVAVTSIDPTIFASAPTAFITTVPEPSSFLFLGLVAGIGASVCWWKRKRQPVSA